MTRMNFSLWFIGDQFKKLNSVGMILWMITVLGFGCWASVMALDREPPFEYLPKEAGSRILPNPAPHAGLVSTDWKLSEPKRECPREIERVFVDRKTGAVVTTMDATPLLTATLTSKTSLSRSFLLPEVLPDQIDYYVVARFRCNLMHVFFPIVIRSPKLPLDIHP
jgi:hypothetical protein